MRSRNCWSPYLSGLFLGALVLPVMAEECENTPELNIVARDIFNLDEPDMFWIHRFANDLHVITRKETLENELAYLKEICDADDKDLQEVERNLRRLKYIKTAEVSRESDGRIRVETSDKWSLLPTADFSRKGGKNRFSIGLKDRNLLGYGIDTEVGYFKDDQRSGYIIDAAFPLFMHENLRGSITLADTDDGSTQAIGLVKPFVTLDAETAFDVSLFRGEMTEQFYLNGDDYYSLSFRDKRFNGSWGRQYLRTENSVLRYRLGMDYQHREFDTLTSDNALMMPADRLYTVPFIELEFIEDDFRELHNIHVINQIEDFNMGWHLTGKLGVNVAPRDHDEARYVLGATMSKGLELGDDTLMLTSASVIGETGSTALPRWVAKLDNEVFHRLNNRFGLYTAQHLTASHNPYLDEPVVIGEENGVRGYPLEFQRGNSAAAFTAEVRYYPDINLFNLFDLGAAVFADTGKTFGGDFDNTSNQWLSSVGIGARFYSQHASDTKVIHVDMSFPMLNHEGVDNVAFLITTRSSF